MDCSPYRSVVGVRTREAASRGVVLPFSMTTCRTLLRFRPGASLLSGRSHDPRWLRLHPQLLGADASGGWTEWIEDVDVALADAPGAADLALAVEARIDLVADGEPGTCAQTAQHGGARRQREVGVVVDGQRTLLPG